MMGKNGWYGFDYEEFIELFEFPLNSMYIRFGDYILNELLVFQRELTVFHI